jgi:hypothetical protein
MPRVERTAYDRTREIVLGTWQPMQGFAAATDFTSGSSVSPHTVRYTTFAVGDESLRWKTALRD